MDDKLSFLSGEDPVETPPAAETTTETPASPPETPSEGPARGPDGKFVAKQPAAAPEPEAAPAVAPEPAQAATPPATPPEPSPEIGGLMKAMLDEREKRQAAERRAQELEARFHKPPEPQTPPDIYEDPEGHANFLRQEQANAALNLKLEITEDLARQKHGDALVDEVQAWLKTNPRVAAEGIQQRNPYEFAVTAYQREQALAKLTPDRLAAFEAFLAAQAANPTPPAPTPATPAQPLPPRSMASTPSAGGNAKPGEMVTGPGEAFGSLFKG